MSIQWGGRCCSCSRLAPQSDPVMTQQRAGRAWSRPEEARPGAIDWGKWATRRVRPRGGSKGKTNEEKGDAGPRKRSIKLE